MKAFCELRNGSGKGHPSGTVQGAADKVAFKGRILLGLDDIAGYLSSLRKGFDRLGVPVDAVFVRPHAFDYEAAPVPAWVRTWQKSAARLDQRPSFLHRLGHACWSLLIWLWALTRYRVFIFSFGKTFLPYNLDLPFYRLLGKRTVFVFLGTDCRADYLGASAYIHEWSAAQCAQAVAERKARLRKIERYADYLVNTPGQALLMERPFVHVHKLGMPREVQVVPHEPTGTGRLRVLHSPSRTGIKGSKRIRAIAESLQARHDFEWVELTGRPNAEVLDEIARCDFVVDQLYADTPMAVFAGEAACLGKPALVGGAYAEYLARHVKADDIPPSLFVPPDQFESAFERLLSDSTYRVELGNRAREYVHSRWRPEQVAARYLELIGDVVPESWWFDPSQIEATAGISFEAERVRAMIRELLALPLPDPLQLSDKPLQAAALRAYAERASDETPLL